MPPLAINPWTANNRILRFFIAFSVVTLMFFTAKAQGVVTYGPYEGSKSFVGERLDASGKLAAWAETFQVAQTPVKLYCWLELSKPLGVNKAEITVYNSENKEIQFLEMKTEPKWEQFLVPLTISERGRFKVNITTPFDEEDGGYSIANTYWVEIQ